MTKKENLEDPNSCWNKAADDEPVFVLRAHDKLAPTVIRYWTALLRQEYDYQPRSALKKVVAADEVADLMELWPDRKVPD